MSEPPPSTWELSFVPDDIAFSIASFLEASDVCSLGSCSRFWRAISASDCVWQALAKKRWPSLLASSSGGLPEAPEGSEYQIGGDASSSSGQGWRDFYVAKHRKLACHVSSIVKFVDKCSQGGSLEVGNYLKAINDLRSVELGFSDVQLFLLARKHGVILNLIGLHYTILWLGIPPNEIMQALQSLQVTELQVCVSWYKFGRWFYGFRLPDEHRYRKVSLGELAMAKEDEVLSVLKRGAVHEVFRVQITSITTNS